MAKHFHRVSIALFSATFLIAASPSAEAQTKSTAKTLTLGVVFQDPRQPLKEHFQALVDYAGRKLSATGETQGRVVVVPSAVQMTKSLDERTVDFYMESPYATYLINRSGAARLLLRRWKGGLAEYHGIIFTAKESDIKRFEDLRGKIIAFEDPGSTSGYFLPKLLLLRKGFSVVEKQNLETKIPHNEIGYVFANTANNVVNLVLQQKTAAGAFSSDDYAGLDEKTRSLISTLGQTEAVPRHLVSVRKDLPESVTKRLKEILLGMDRDKEGQEILRKTDNTTKFDSLPGGEEAVRRQLVELYRPRRGK